MVIVRVCWSRVPMVIVCLSCGHVHGLVFIQTWKIFKIILNVFIVIIMSVCGCIRCVEWWVISFYLPLAFYCNNYYYCTPFSILYYYAIKFSCSSEFKRKCYNYVIHQVYRQPLTKRPTTAVIVSFSIKMTAYCLCRCIYNSSCAKNLTI